MSWLPKERTTRSRWRSRKSCRSIVCRIATVCGRTSIVSAARSIAAALDLSQEDPRVVDRYTLKTAGGDAPSTTSDRPIATQKFLLARRLVEAGVRCVSLSLSDFDTHSNNFPRLR